MIREEIKRSIEKALKELSIRESDFVVEHPTDLKIGDYSTNVAIKYGEHKEKLLQYIVGNLPDSVERVETAGPGFINFYLKKDFFKKSLGEIINKGEGFGKNDHAKGFKVIVEHTQPNPFKDFHIGHLMNNAIGESLARIIRANGGDVITATYHGDKGLHVAKAVWAMKKGLPLLKAYAEGHKAYEEDDNAKKEILEINKKIYDESNEDINKIYKEGWDVSFNLFKLMYKRLDSHFDNNFYENISGEIGKKLVLENLDKVFERSDGAVIFKGEKFGLHTRVFITKDDLPTYEAKELGLAELKKDAYYPYGESITITANEQDSFFDVVEVAIGEVFPELKGKLKHLSHGMLRLPSGKMSSRTGDVITAEALIEMVKEKVKGDEAVAIGAIKYMILRQAIGNDIVFDIEKSVSTEGDSGVYLQYAYARTNSLLEKAEIKIDPSAPREHIHEVEKLLYRFPEIVERAGQEYAPHHIVTYLTQLAGSFNNFYAHEEVLGDSVESPYRLAIVKAFNIVMKNGLMILGIKAPERM